jgi:urease accessory protein
MLRAFCVVAAGRWKGEPVDSVVLDYDDRHRRRMTMKGTHGLEFLLDLDEAVALRGGDALRLDDGRLIEVVAAPEPLAEIRAADMAALVRVAWHLGNRHLPTELTRRALRIRRDPVIEEMARGLGAAVVAIEAPFNPEGGAYAKGGHAGHEHHDHNHAHAHAEAHSHAEAHVHGPDCGHDHHDHDHDHGHKH